MKYRCQSQQAECDCLHPLHISIQRITSQLDALTSSLTCRLTRRSIKEWKILGLSRWPQVSIALITILIYGFYLATFMLVGYWALQRSNGWSVLGLFVVYLFLIWLWFPRFSEAPPDIVLANKESFPELHRLVSLIADSLGSPKPQVLLVEQFTAAYARLGWRRQPHLMLGHSLLSLLDSAELITVIAHELTHERDGSISRHLFVRLAMTAWYRWCRLWWHVANLETLHRAFLPIAYLGAIILLPCLALGRRLNNVANIDRQSGEIYADYRAQQIAQPASITNLFKSRLKKGERNEVK